jgi:hypothetical protein
MLPHNTSTLYHGADQLYKRAWCSGGQFEYVLGLLRRRSHALKTPWQGACAFFLV